VTASTAIATALSEYGYDIFWELSSFVSQNNYYGTPVDTLQAAAGKGGSMEFSVSASENVLAIPSEFEWSGVSPTLRNYVSRLSRVNIAAPLLSDPPFVNVVQPLLPTLHVEALAEPVPVSERKVAKYFMYLDANRVETVPIKFTKYV
jgi:hypothetical protein